jgi:hypothetical protein
MFIGGQRRNFLLRGTQDGVHEGVVVDLDDTILVGIDAFERLCELLDVHASADEPVKGNAWREASGIGNSCYAQSDPHPGCR